jgi:energy-coupling factor transporter ATP-binding protein EcfA2
VKYGVVTNGLQYIVFEAFRQGSDWRDGRCVIFRSLDDIKQNYVLFWNMMNRESVRAGSLKKYVSEEESAIEFTIPVSRLHAKGSSLARNYLSPLLDPIVNYVFADLTEEYQKEVLEKCYVAKRDFQDAGTYLGRHFDLAPNLLKKYNVQTILESPVKAGNFQELYERCEQFLRTASHRGSLIVLMGGIGCGKTTFVHHFFKFVVRNPETVWFYVDFTKASPEASLIEHHIYESILQDFETKYPKQFKELKDELANVNVCSMRPEPKDIAVLLSELALRGYVVSLVLDNVDQHSHISPEYQERTVQIAKNLTERLRTITILTLREESFFRSTTSGVLDAFLPPVFQLSSPDFEDLIHQRIAYALGLLEMGDEEIQEKTRSSINFGEQKDTLKTFFKIVNHSLGSSRRMGQEILRFMDEVSGGDMRVALHFFRTFLVSGNTDISEMLRIGPGYLIPFHHVIKSIVLEHSRLYSASTSRIMNVFTLNPKWCTSHFLHLRILNYLHDRRAYETQYGRGFVQIDSIIREAEELSIDRAGIAESLAQMAHYGLVQFENQSKKGYDSATYVAITNMGSYYLAELCEKFVYLDLMWMDTPIRDKLLVDELLDYVVELKEFKDYTDVDDRLCRTRLFLDYLNEREEADFLNSPEYRDSDLTKREFMSQIIKAFEEQKRYIQKKK